MKDSFEFEALVGEFSAAVTQLPGRPAALIPILFVTARGDVTALLAGPTFDRTTEESDARTFFLPAAVCRI